MMGAIFFIFGSILVACVGAGTGNWYLAGAAVTAVYLLMPYQYPSGGR